MQRDLVERARDGDVEAFTTLVDRKLDGMFRVAMAILGHEADARDATQEALTSIWRELPSLRDPALFDAWSGRVLVNACRQSLKRRRRIEVREIALAEPGAGSSDGSARSGTPGFDEELARQLALERAFDRLDADARVLLVLHHLEDRSVADMARILGVPVGTVKSRLYAARQLLERALEREER